MTSTDKRRNQDATLGRLRKGVLGATHVNRSGTLFPFTYHSYPDLHGWKEVLLYRMLAWTSFWEFALNWSMV